MWNNYIGQQIRRCNRNLLIVNVLLLAALGIYAYANRRYLANFLLGSVPISSAELQTINDPNTRFRFFVTIKGDKTFDTGIQSVEQTIDQYSNKVQSTTVEADYRILATGGRFLLVKADPGSSASSFSGALEPIPDSVYQEIIAPLINQEPKARAMFVPAMLNANDYREEGWWTLACFVPLLALAGWNLWKWQKRNSEYALNPIYKRVCRFGRPEEVFQKIDTAVRLDPVEKIGKAKIHGTWLLHRTLFRLDCFYIPDLVWIYQKVTRHYTNLIPTGKSFSVLIYDRYGYYSEFQIRKKKVEPFLTLLIQRCPWVVAGFSKELEALWKSQTADFIAAVDERRKNSGVSSVSAAHA